MLNRSYFAVMPNITNQDMGLAQSNFELIEEYLAWKRSYSKTAYRSYRIWVTRFQEFVNKPPEMLRHTDYTAFAQGLQEKYASKSIEFALNVVHNYLRFFSEQGRLHFPLYLARVPHGFAQSHEAVTEDEYIKIVTMFRGEQLPQLRELAIIMLLHDTGMRIGELLSLDIEDIEENRSAVIRTEKSFRERRIFWNLDTDDVLQRYLVERVNNNAGNESEALFVSKSSRDGSFTKITARSIERSFQTHLKNAGINRKLCPHSFRHSFIHRLAKLSVPDAIIAQLVGHSTPTTIAHYTKLSRPEYEHYAKRQLDFAAEHHKSKEKHTKYDLYTTFPLVQETRG